MAIPRGLSELAIYPITGVSTLGAGVLLTGPRSFNFNIDSSTDELEGGNVVIASAPGPRSLSGAIELGDIALPVLGILFGGTVAVTGTAPNTVEDHTQSNDTTPRYFRIIGQAPDTNIAGGAYRATVLKAQATAGLDETMETNSWNTPTINIQGSALSGALVKRQVYAVMSALTTTAPA